MQIGLWIGYFNAGFLEDPEDLKTQLRAHRERFIDVAQVGPQGKVERTGAESLPSRSFCVDQIGRPPEADKLLRQKAALNPDSAEWDENYLTFVAFIKKRSGMIAKRRKEMSRKPSRKARVAA